MPKLTKSQRKAVKTMVVAYEALQCAIRDHNIGAQVCWATLLRDAQTETGLEIMTPDRLRYYATRKQPAFEAAE